MLTVRIIRVIQRKMHGVKVELKLYNVNCLVLEQGLVRWVERSYDAF
jgi:hypothetical protein